MASIDTISVEDPFGWRKDFGNSAFPRNDGNESEEEIVFEEIASNDDDNKDDEEEEGSLDLGNTTVEATRSTFQASFAEQTASEMQQIVNMWNLSSPALPMKDGISLERLDDNVIQKQLSALVYKSPPTKQNSLSSPAFTLSTEPSSSDDSDDGENYGDDDDDVNSGIVVPNNSQSSPQVSLFFPSTEVLRQRSQVQNMIKSTERQTFEVSQALTDAEKQSVEAEQALNKVKRAVEELQATYSSWKKNGEEEDESLLLGKGLLFTTTTTTTESSSPSPTRKSTGKGRQGVLVSVAKFTTRQGLRWLLRFIMVPFLLIIIHVGMEVFITMQQQKESHQ